MNIKTKRIISILLLTVMIISLCTVVNAEQPTDEFGFSGMISEEAALKNSEVFTEFYKTLDPDGEYSVDVKYDSTGKITDFIVKCGLERSNIHITYNGEDFLLNKTEITANENAVENTVEISIEDVAVFSDDIGNYDNKMVDAAVKNRIAEAQKVWNEKSEMRSAAHTEALIARADYCVIYPKSTFASHFLESGNLETNTKFRRTLQYTDPQMYGADIIALQRALMANGNLDSTDVKTDEYGHFGPSTQAAVKEYQREKGLSADGIAGKNTLRSLFNAGADNNKVLTSFESLNKINVFRLKHDAVCTALAAKLGGTIYREAFIAGAGINKNGGRADVIRVLGTSKMVWEVKPDSRYGKKTGGPQVKTYVDCSKTAENSGRAYCPLTYGSDIASFSFPWTNGKNVFVSSSCSDGTKAQGVVFYSDRKGNNPIWQPSTSPVLLPKPNEDYKTISWPEPQTVYNGLIAAGVAVASFYVVKGIIAIAASIPSGGTSLLLLCF